MSMNKMEHNLLDITLSEFLEKAGKIFDNFMKVPKKILNDILTSFYNTYTPQGIVTEQLVPISDILGQLDKNFVLLYEGAPNGSGIESRINIMLKTINKRYSPSEQDYIPKNSPDVFEYIASSGKIRKLELLDKEDDKEPEFGELVEHRKYYT